GLPEFSLVVLRISREISEASDAPARRSESIRRPERLPSSRGPIREDVRGRFGPTACGASRNGRTKMRKGDSMKQICTTGMTVCATFLLMSAAHAQVTLNSVRVGAKDTVALAKFYQSAFGMQETNRLNGGGGPEIFVNFGATVDAAKANKSEPIVIMHRDSD